MFVDNDGVPWPMCPECESEDIFYENPGDGFVCCDCGHVMTAEEAKVFEEWERTCTHG